MVQTLYRLLSDFLFYFILMDLQATSLSQLVNSVLDYAHLEAQHYTRCTGQTDTTINKNLIFCAPGK